MARSRSRSPARRSRSPRRSRTPVRRSRSVSYHSGPEELDIPPSPPRARSSSSGSSSDSSSRRSSSSSASRSPSPKRGRAELGRIPKKSEYRDAEQEVPPAPAASSAQKRKRVSLDATSQSRFEKWSKGTFLSHVDRQKLLDALPLPASVFAMPPLVEEELRSYIKEDVRTRNDKIYLREGELKAFYESTLNVLNITELIRKIGLPEAVTGYLDVQGRLLSAILKDYLGMIREMTLRQMGISNPSRAMPGYRRQGLTDDEYVLHEVSDELRPALFRKQLRRQLSAGDGTLKKGIEAARSSDRPSSSSAQRPSTSRIEPKKRTDKSPYKQRDSRKSGAKRGGRGKK